MREWYEWLLEWRPSVRRLIESPCEVCLQSDLPARIPSLAQLPHGLSHTLVERIEEELRLADGRYYAMRMASERSNLDIQLRAHDFDGDLFEVDYRSELRSRYWAAEWVERDRARRWIWSVRRKLTVEVARRLAALDKDIAEVVEAKLRVLGEQIPDRLDPDVVLGDADLLAHIAPRVTRFVTQWADWIFAGRWRSSHEVPSGQLCVFCAQHWLAPTVSRMPHSAQHELFTLAGRLEEQVVAEYRFAPPESAAPETTRILHRISVRRVLARSLVTHAREISDAVQIYVTEEIEIEAREAAQYL